ncbi:phosphoinositide phosphatase SAC8 isoform X2 [Impatiens glandulifera]|uniref:phosphoinositide phosphatase SAC8 isoform X2 n=1 Tax=Impatiens glandulifera TaxID=253017 RepID=UPI001FB16907|nr:phosphoinositide phosphatase SAC8 isoform X2 [Impatiens glandulifera]
MEIESRAGLFKLWNQLELHELPEKFVIRAVDSPNLGFSISRSDGQVHSLQDDHVLSSTSKVSTIYGVVGTIRLLAGTYLLVITSRKEIGDYLGFPVYQVTSMKFLGCNESLKLSTYQEKKDEAYFRNLLRIVESTPGLYYSYETDLSLNLQRRFKLAEGWMSKPIWKQGDPRFVWNRNILEDLIENKLDDFIIPLIQGSFRIGQLKIKNEPATITLVSRRCTRRLGTRMWRRGANMNGDTANTIETEQLLEHKGFRSSFLQIRGSIPLLWEQIVDLSYKPSLNIISHEETPKIVERHFHDLMQRYGDVIAVNLTDKDGDEGRLSAAYAAEMQKLNSVRYVSFDFHHVCGNSKFDQIHVLYDEIAEDFEKHGHRREDTSRAERNCKIKLH